MSSDHTRPTPYSRDEIRAQSGLEAAEFDARAIRDLSVPQSVLMENAGRSAALVIQALHLPRRLVGMVGAGNNGGDALVVLRTMAAWGVDVMALLVADRGADDPVLHGWPIRTVSDADLPDDERDRLLDDADVIVDGVLGTGVRGAARDRQAAAIEAMNRSSTPVVALDMPSGADATTGDVPGSTVHAALTISFGAPKTGALLHPARGYIGRHVTVEIGFPPLNDSDANALVVTPSWARRHLPVRDTDTHKNRVGRLLIVGGGVGMAGAVILAARAAFHAGAGLVQICSVSANRDAVHAGIPEAMFIASDDVEALTAAAQAADAIVAGPGMGAGEESAAVLNQVIECGTQPLLLDADALNLAAAGAVSLSEVGAGRPVLITPHPGEMARLAPDLVQTASRLEVARTVATEHAIAVLFKGAPSVVATPSGPVLIDTQGSSDLAVAGMGDTLSGVCGALMAQGLEPEVAGSVGLYLSGRAARRAARGAGLTPSDVSEHLPDVLTETTEAETDLPFSFVIFDAEAAR